MARNYYYFISALPVLFFDQKPSMTVEKYLSLCGDYLHPQDESAVRLALREDLSARQGASFLWSSYRHSLKNELAYERAVRRGQDPLKSVRGGYSINVVLREAVVEALDDPDPLEAQRRMDIQAWRFLDELEVGHYFDVDRAVVYGVRLRILERYDVMSLSKGPDVFTGYIKDDRLASVLAVLKG